MAQFFINQAVPPIDIMMRYIIPALKFLSLLDVVSDHGPWAQILM
jgi:hypothetical protein